MANASEIVFTRLSDGTLLGRQPDGSYRPVASQSDRAKLAALTEADIETLAATDPDHPGLDDAFWEGVPAAPPAKEAISIKLDSDVLQFFRKDGRGYQTRINAILRHYMQASDKTG
ncbi:BrnA antitoxin family protein [Methylobacterium sp. J-076]|uniref:BrnA antitoxin family protein n=1 Tax=Methylobacterium sp. J-076 TaxID=2836655 RepID=UPI001FBA8C6E|nr:BrnA antitoxin family protein [Methylobacterium sp. J-076]MCJ2014375.1 BrnA antitoxin family protein [Methylobacterium sp. J-076]